MIRLAAALALLVGCEAGDGPEEVVPVGVPAPALVPVLSRLVIECHPGPHPECVALVVCRDCDPAVEQCDAWQGYCNLAEESSP